MTEMYYVIQNSDGDTIVNTYTKAELLAEIDEGSFGEGIMTEFPENHDTNYWCGEALIIKGKMVAPQAEQVITKYKIE